MKPDTLSLWICFFVKEENELLMLFSSQVLLPPVVACVEDSFYKITSEALLVTQQLIRVIRPQGLPATAGGFDPKPFVREVQ